jgi:hypothetical protein
VEDFIGSVVCGDGDARGGGGKHEPALFSGGVADELGVVFAAGTHEAGADGGDADSFVAELGVEAFGEADESELCGGVGEHVGDGDLAADAGDVSDGGAALSGERSLCAHVGEGGPGGVEGCEEVDLHGLLEDFEGLGFDGADFDGGGVVDEDVDAVVAGDGLGYKALAFFWLREVGGYEVEVLGMEMGVAGEEGGLGEFELGEVARAEDELDGVAGEAGGDGEAEASGAAGDDDDGAGGAFWNEPAGADGAGDENGCGGGDDGRGDRCSGDGGGGRGDGEGGEADTAHSKDYDAWREGKAVFFRQWLPSENPRART